MRPLALLATEPVIRMVFKRVVTFMVLLRSTKPTPTIARQNTSKQDIQTAVAFSPSDTSNTFEDMTDERGTIHDPEDGEGHRAAHDTLCDLQTGLDDLCNLLTPHDWQAFEAYRDYCLAKDLGDRHTTALTRSELKHLGFVVNFWYVQRDGLRHIKIEDEETGIFGRQPLQDLVSRLESLDGPEWYKLSLTTESISEVAGQGMSNNDRNQSQVVSDLSQGVQLNSLDQMGDDSSRRGRMETRRIRDFDGSVLSDGDC